MKRIISIALTLVLIFSLTAIASAETLQIGIPDDGTNLSRGIKLLETAGLITVDPEAGYTPEIADITGYIYDIEVTPVQANTLPSTLGDFGASAINSTFSVPYGLFPSQGLISEKQSEGSDNPYINVIVARTEEADKEVYKKIVEAYQTQLVAEFLIVTRKEAQIPAFEYDEEITLTEEEATAIIEYVSPKEGKEVVKVGVVGSSNDQWQAVQKVLDEENAGIYIELIELDAYNIPNEALNSGEIDLNAFQHKAFLNNEIAVNGYDITPIGDTLIAPLTLYSEKFDTLDALKEAAGLIAG